MVQAYILFLSCVFKPYLLINTEHLVLNNFQNKTLFIQQISLGHLQKITQIMHLSSDRVNHWTISFYYSLETNL